MDIHIKQWNNHEFLMIQWMDYINYGIIVGDVWYQINDMVIVWSDWDVGIWKSGYGPVMFL